MAFHRITGCLPGIEPPQKSPDLGEPKLIQLQRRPGAGLLGRSGAIKDDLSLLGQFAVALFDLVLRDGKGTWDMTKLVAIAAPGVNDDHVLISVQLLLQFLRFDARHLGEGGGDGLFFGHRWGGGGHQGRRGRR